MLYNSGKLFSYIINSHKNFYECRQISNNLLQGSRFVADKTTETFLKSLDFSDNIRNHEYLSAFTEKFSNWINSGSSVIIGLDSFEPDYSNGTTQSFDSFYLRHRNKRFRCLTGEYFYHLKSWISNKIDWSFITDTNPLCSGDALVLSLPFCDTGNIIEYDSLLQICTDKNIPVLIDCCYFTLCGNITVDLNYDCIDTVCFSLSKTFPVSHLRIGVRYTRHSIFDGQKLHHSINYNNINGSYVGYKFIENFKPDYIYSNYKEKQQQACDFFNLQPSDSVLFAVGDANWQQYSRKNLLNAYKLELNDSMFVNRICLNAIYENWEMFNAIRNII
jgi:hypothetical protein